MAVSKEYLDNLVAELDQDKVNRFVEQVAIAIENAKAISNGTCPDCWYIYCECVE